MEICYITPGGEVSGLTYGDRKFNMVGKGNYLVAFNVLYVRTQLFLVTLNAYIFDSHLYIL